MLYFKYQKKSINEVAPSLNCSPYLAYIKWYSLLPAALDPKFKMYKSDKVNSERTQICKHYPGG